MEEENKALQTERVYANIVGCEVTTFDFTFIFGSKRVSSKNDKILPEEVVSEVIMSPQQAKAFALMLSNNLRQYEKSFGVINLDPNPSEVESTAAKA
ncbi:MAG: DUF3467 domain-containing protein [Desulfitobacteriaceae bacterium]|nr:DUF3467 domain-containing protein [Desulfitobacteriaceae bacterium]MDD4752219.1 DUF3467 domain-containing protein [Desulfitobacteriaceae bacterium]